MTIKISQIQNAELKKAAQASNTNVKDDFIDSKEILIFTKKASDVLSKKLCTQKEFSEIMQLAAEENELAKLDSIHNEKNNMNAQDKEVRKMELKQNIQWNKERLELIKYRLAQKNISKNEFMDDFKNSSALAKVKNISACTAAMSTVGLIGSGGVSIGGFILDSFAVTSISIASATLFGAAIVVGGAIAGGIAAYNYFTEDKEDRQKQEEMRNAYKQEYHRLIAENKQMEAELKKLG